MLGLYMGRQNTKTSSLLGAAAAVTALGLSTAPLARGAASGISSAIGKAVKLPETVYQTYGTRYPYAFKFPAAAAGLYGLYKILEYVHDSDKAKRRKALGIPDPTADSEETPAEPVQDIVESSTNQDQESLDKYLDFLKESEYMALRPTRAALALKLATDSDASEVVIPEYLSAGDGVYLPPDPEPEKSQDNNKQTPQKQEKSQAKNKPNKSDQELKQVAVEAATKQHEAAHTRSIAGLAKTTLPIAGGLLGAYLAYNAYKKLREEKDKLRSRVSAFGNKKFLQNSANELGYKLDSAAADRYLFDSGTRTLDDLLELRNNRDFLQPEDMAIMRTLADAKKANPEYYRQLGREFKSERIPGLRTAAPDESWKNELRALKKELLDSVNPGEVKSQLADLRKQIEISKSNPDEIRSLISEARNEFKTDISKLYSDNKATSSSIGDKLDSIRNEFNSELKRRDSKTLADSASEMWESLSPYGKATAVAVPTLATAYGGYRALSPKRRRR